jgi:Zn-dependent protease
MDDRAIPLGRLAGVRIGMSWVVPFVAALYALSLATSLLPRSIPDQPTSSYWLSGAVGAGFLFLSLLAHEMGHALVGRAEGIGVRGITLTLLGGYTQFETEPSTPGAELRVSGIGPITNFVLAGVFWAVAEALGGGFGLTALLAETFEWLAFVNLLLAAVNMLPGSPLDGGAVLGAIVWMVTRDRTRAQTITSVIGIALGVGLALWGLAGMRREDEGFGLWGLIIGIFIATSAWRGLRSAPTVGALRDTPIGDVMLPDPPVVPEWAALSDVVTRAQGWLPHTAFPVQSADGRITGLLTAQLVLAVDPSRWPEVRAGEVAWPIERVPTVPATEPVLTAVQRSQSAGVDRILVVWPDGRVAGVAGSDAAHRALDHRRAAAVAPATVPPHGRQP